jgi:FkbM family methyltransferase
MAPLARGLLTGLLLFLLLLLAASPGARRGGVADLAPLRAAPAVEASLAVAVDDAAWPDYIACAARGSEKAAVDEALLREYAQQGEGFLGADSVVVDVGGFVGEAVQTLLRRFACRIFVFEPVPEFAARLEERFRPAGGRVVVLNYGIGPRDENITFVVDGDRSHVADARAGGQVVHMRTLAPFFEQLERQHGARFVDMMHVNCEGCEFAVLEYLLRSPWIERVRHLLVQFHSFHDGDAVDRRCTLRARLARTHTLAWDRAFVWERWDLRKRN